MEHSLDFTNAEQAMISRIMRAEKDLPDDLWCVAMVQELACLMAKLEPMLADSQMATLLGCGAFISRHGKAELTAQIQTTMLFGRLRAPPDNAR